MFKWNHCFSGLSYQDNLYVLRSVFALSKYRNHSDCFVFTPGLPHNTLISYRINTLKVIIICTSKLLTGSWAPIYTCVEQRLLYLVWSHREKAMLAKMERHENTQCTHTAPAARASGLQIPQIPIRLKQTSLIHGGSTMQPAAPKGFSANAVFPDIMPPSLGLVESCPGGIQYWV